MKCHDVPAASDRFATVICSIRASTSPNPGITSPLSLHRGKDILIDLRDTASIPPDRVSQRQRTLGGELRDEQAHLPGNPCLWILKANDGPVSKTVRLDVDDGTSQDASAGAGATDRCVDLEFDRRARQQPACRVDGGCITGDVDQRRLVSGSYAQPHHTVLLHALETDGEATIHSSRQAVVHVRVRTLNRSTRVLPVCPKTRMENCAPLRPRM